MTINMVGKKILLRNVYITIFVILLITIGCYIIQSRYFNSNHHGYHIVNISSKNIDKFIVYTSRSDSIMETLETGRSFASMGEIIITLSAIFGFEKLGYQVVIVNSRYDFQLHNNNVKGYVVDYKTLGNVKDLVLTKESIGKVSFFCSWGRTDDEMKKLWSNGNYYLPATRVLTPYDLGGHTSDGKRIANNTFLGFLPSILELPNKSSHDIVLSQSISGYLMGKARYLLFYNNTDVLIDYLGNNGHTLYITSDEITETRKGIENLGLLSRQNFIKLLKHIKYIVGSGQPLHGTSLVEIFQEEVFFLAPSSQIPYSIQQHPNYICTDNMNFSTIEKFISNVSTGKIKPKKIPLNEFSLDSYMNRICSIYDIVPCLF